MALTSFTAFFSGSKIDLGPLPFLSNDNGVSALSGAHLVMSWFRQHIFSLGLLAAVLLAYLCPGPGAPGGWLLPQWTAKLGVALIFFLQGMGWATKTMLAGGRPTRLQGFALSWNFIGFPLLTGLLLVVVGPWLSPGLTVGFLLLSVLPTTISSATALTIIAGGAVPQSIFSSVASNLLALLVVPVWGLLLLQESGAGELSVFPVLRQLCWLVLLPLLLGQGLRRIYLDGAKTWARHSRWLTRSVILFIVYTAFAQSVEAGVLGQTSANELLRVCFFLLLLLGFSGFLIWKTSGWLRLSSTLRVTGFYSASQKSLATGLPLIQSLLLATEAGSEAALVLIPLLLFHPAQLLLGALLVPRFREHCAPSGGS